MICFLTHIAFCKFTCVSSDQSSLSHDFFQQCLSTFFTNLRFVWYTSNTIIGNKWIDYYILDLFLLLHCFIIFWEMPILFPMRNKLLGFIEINLHLIWARGLNNFELDCTLILVACAVDSFESTIWLFTIISLLQVFVYIYWIYSPLIFLGLEVL